MRFHEQPLFQELKMLIDDKKQDTLLTNLSSEEVTLFKYFLTKNYYYTVVIDDYAFEINDKITLLEALFYQIRLIDMHSLNWDALQESLCDSQKNFSSFKGICLLIRNGRVLQNKLPKDLGTFFEIVDHVNSHSKDKKIIIINNMAQEPV